MRYNQAYFLGVRRIMKIAYGIVNGTTDVTEICKSRLMVNNTITIPSGDDNRAAHFTDNHYGISKKIFITIDNRTSEYDESLVVKINQLDQTIVARDIDRELSIIHSKLNINYGSFSEELPEQKMVLRYFTGDEKVLEIGGNIGRNSLVIAHILKNRNNNNLVTLECDRVVSGQLAENRDLNHFDFRVESSALSKRGLIQRGWDTIVSDTLFDGFTTVDIISYQELKDKYRIEFDTLVIDCEGAFYYILMDMPEILKNIQLIIMENDYFNVEHKNYVGAMLKENGFYVDYAEGGGFAYYYENFYEVWKKRR